MEKPPDDEQEKQDKCCCVRFVDSLLETETHDPVVEFFLDGKTRKSDEFCSDYWFHIRNNHTLLSICLQHSMHPFSKVFRVLVLIANLALSMFSAGVVCYLQHKKDSLWENLINILIGPIIIFLLTFLLTELAVCGQVQRDGTRKITRVAFKACGEVMFLFMWLTLVPTCVVLALAFSSIDDIDDFRHKDYDEILKDFKPSWHMFVAEWWLQQAAIEWGAEFLLLLFGFLYTRNYEYEDPEQQCLDEVRKKWLKEYGEDTPLIDSK